MGASAWTPVDETTSKWVPVEEAPAATAPPAKSTNPQEIIDRAKFNGGPNDPTMREFLDARTSRYVDAMPFMLGGGLQTIESEIPAAMSTIGRVVDRAKQFVGLGGEAKKIPVNHAEGLPEVEAGQPAATAKLQRTIGKEPTPQNLGDIPATHGEPQASALGKIPPQSVSQPVSIGRPSGWTPPRANRLTGEIEGAPESKGAGSSADLADDRIVQDQIRAHSGRELDSLRKAGNEEGFARNTRPSTPKGVLTGTANRPVKLTSTPGVKVSGKDSPAADSTSEGDLTGILRKSLDQAKVRKRGGNNRPSPSDQ